MSGTDDINRVELYRTEQKNKAIANATSHLHEKCYDSEEVEFVMACGIAALEKSKELGWI